MIPAIIFYEIEIVLSFAFLCFCFQFVLRLMVILVYPVGLVMRKQVKQSAMNKEDGKHVLGEM